MRWLCAINFPIRKPGHRGGARRSWLVDCHPATAWAPHLSGASAAGAGAPYTASSRTCVPITVLIALTPTCTSPFCTVQKRAKGRGGQGNGRRR
eukprot:78621-Chlamydomonas_euryale.AAC.6